MNSQFLLSIVAVCFVFSSCSRNTSSATRASAALQASLRSQENTLNVLDKMSAQSAKAAADGKVVASADSTVQAYVASERAVIEGQRKQLDQAKADVDAYASGKGKKSGRAVVNSANIAVMRSTATLRIVDKKTEVIVDFLGNETFSKSEIKTLFQPGDYALTTSETKEGVLRFRPIVEKMFTFADKYRNSQYQGGIKRLRGEIVITGYSDATPIEPGSNLYQSLVQRVMREDKLTAPTSSNLNRKLSELRAGTIKGLLETIIRTREKGRTDPMPVKIMVSGRGEELPAGLSVNMALNDPNRRVVTFYWVVLPEF